MRTLMLSLAIVATATIQAQSPNTFQRGEVVRVRQSASPSDPKPTQVPLRIVAIPNDQVRVDDSGVYVNDMRVVGFSEHFVASVARDPERAPQSVPEGHYFVMGELRSNQDISEYWGVHPQHSLERVMR